jgi:tRNA threonylcarbamoyladenosine biosynthesis protein TsaE
MLLNIEQTKNLATKLAGRVEAGDVLALFGEVGAGKTTFAQSFIGALLKTPESITSPTFTLMQSYATKRGWRVMHADLYRLKHVNELAELGLEDVFETDVSLIEWPEIAEGILPARTLHIRLEHAVDDCRNIIFSSHSPRWATLLQEYAA